MIKHGRFYSAEGEIQRIPAEPTAGEIDGFGVSGAGQSVNDWPTGVAEIENTGDLVEGLAGGIIDGNSKGLDFQRALAQVERGMASGDDQSYGGEGRIAVAVQQGGVDVGLNVVEVYQGLLPSPGEGFGSTDADKQGANQAGPVGNGNGGKISGIYVGLVESLDDYGVDTLNMGTGGDFGDDSAEFSMKLVLAGHDAGEDFPSVADNGGGGFIAGSLDGQDYGVCGGHADYLLDAGQRGYYLRRKGLCQKNCGCRFFWT